LLARTSVNAALSDAWQPRLHTGGDFLPEQRLFQPDSEQDANLKYQRCSPGLNERGSRWVLLLTLAQTHQ
jgi:hypothetical protein